jgi:hypothetical protein
MANSDLDGGAERPLSVQSGDLRQDGPERAGYAVNGHPTRLTYAAGSINQLLAG